MARHRGCPFCPEDEEMHTGVEGQYPFTGCYVECTRCGARGPMIRPDDGESWDNGSWVQLPAAAIAAAWDAWDERFEEDGDGRAR